MQHEEQGFTLIEFIISLSLGIYLTTIVTTLYFSFQKTVVGFQSIHEIEQNGCIALSWLTRDIRMAGFIGPSSLFDMKVDNQTSLSPTYSLIGWSQGVNTLHEPLPIHGAYENSDVLLLQYAEPNAISVIKAEQNLIQGDAKLKFHPNSILLIADCKHAETVQLSHIQLRHRYTQTAMIGPLYRIIYYVAPTGPTGRKTFTKEPIYALYRRDLNAPLSYFKADAVEDWLKVKTVHLILHLTSLESAQSNKPLKQQWQQIIMVRARQTRP